MVNLDRFSDTFKPEVQIDIPEMLKATDTEELLDLVYAYTNALPKEVLICYLLDNVSEESLISYFKERCR